MGVLRKTKSLKAILQVFESPKSAYAVVDLVKRFEQDMNKTTVYRILERLEQEGIVHSFIGKDGLKWMAKCGALASAEGTTDNIHPHFQCSVCGKAECLDLDITIPAVEDYQIDSASFILVGNCGKCQ